MPTISVPDLHAAEPFTLSVIYDPTTNMFDAYFNEIPYSLELEASNGGSNVHFDRVEINGDLDIVFAGFVPDGNGVNLIHCPRNLIFIKFGISFHLFSRL